MKRILRGLSLLLCAALLCVPAMAAETESDPAAGRLGPVAVWGTVTRLEGGGLLVKNDGEGLSEVILHGESILCLDAVSGEAVDIGTLEDGDTIYAWVGPAMTMSLPPQATALLILTNIPADYAVPQFYEIVSVAHQAMPAIEPPPALTYTEVTAAGGKVLTITDQATLLPYLTKNIVRLEDLRPGTRILVWSDSDGEPAKVLVFPYEYRGYVNFFEGGTVTLNGAALGQKAKVTAEGETLLPIRAVAEALGVWGLDRIGFDPSVLDKSFFDLSLLDSLVFNCAGFSCSGSPKTGEACSGLSKTGFSRSGFPGLGSGGLGCSRIVYSMAPS